MTRTRQTDGYNSGHIRIQNSDVKRISTDEGGAQTLSETEMIQRGLKDARTIAPTPVITLQPVGASVLSGGSATFTVAATGFAVVYQWRRNGVTIPGATSPSYTVSNAQLVDNGAVFTCVVSNDFGSVTSNGASLTVSAVAPTITTEPQSVSVGAGVLVTLSVVATGTAPLSYQWRRNGSDIPGATSSSYQFTTVPSDDGAVFACTVSNMAGSDVSNNATVSVSYSAPQITAHPANRAVAVGGSTTFTVTATGSQTLSYQWRKNSSNIPGATSATLSLSSLQLVDSGAVYDCVVSDAYNSVTSNTASLTVHVPVSITTQPTSQSIAENAGATFSVVATGTGPLTYQWRKNGVDISGATSSSLVLTSVPFSDNGASYTCFVSGPYSSVLSSAAVLTVTQQTAVVYLGGSFSSMSNFSLTRNRTAALSADATTASTILPWNPNVAGSVGAMVLSGSDMYIAGAFSSVQGVTRNYVACVEASAEAGTPALRAWNPNCNSNVYVMVLSGSNMYLGGTFTTVRGTARNYAACVDATVTESAPTLRAWNPDPNGSVTSMLLSGSNMYLGGLFSTVRGTARNCAACVDSNVDSSAPTLRAWNPNCNGYINVMILSGSNMYIGGAFTTVRGSARNRAACLDATASNSTPTLFAWNPNCNGVVYTMVLSGTAMYIGGQFTTVRGSARSNAAAVNSTASAATPELYTWAPSVNAEVRGMALVGSHMFLVGSFSDSTRAFAQAVASLVTDSAWQRDWTGRTDSTVNCIVYKP